jgi:hypothetical protein
MDGTASMTFYRWTSNPLATHSWTSGTSSNCSGPTTEWESRLVYDDSSNPATWYYETRSRTRTCNFNNPGYSWGSYGSWSSWTNSGSVNFPNTSSTSYHEGRTWYSGAWHYGHSPHDHTTGTYSNLIFNLPSVVTSVNFRSPKWTHGFVDYTISWSGNVPSYSTAPTTYSSGNLPYGTMNSNGSELRFTGSADQITAAGTTLTTATLNLPNKIWFDQLWNGNYNGVTIGGWNPVTQGVQSGQTLGFWHGYNGTNITVNNGILLLGEDASCPDQKFSITSSSLVTVDAYNTNGAPALCVAMPTVVTYNPVSGGQPTVAGNTLNITNTNGGCNQVDFCSFFNPGFTGNGVLLINPNVTNFKAGATFTTAQLGNINIFSTKITTTGDFLYTSTRTAGDLDIKITTPQTPNCDDCGYFSVSNNFTTNISAATGGKISITDDTPGTQGHVYIGGNLTHTGSTGTDLTYTTDVDNSINVVGTTTLTANRDDITFNSSESWIKFEDDFTYIGGSASPTAASDLAVHAYGNPCVTNTCGFTGGYVWFVGDVLTLNETNGTVSVKSESHYVRMDNGFAHTGIDGDMLVDGETRVDIWGSTGTPAAGVGIKRNGIGNDRIISGSGHIMIQDKLTYNQTVAAPAGSGLTVRATGGICALECGAHVGGAVWIIGDVTTTNTGKGYTNIISDNHYVNLVKGISHVGTGGDLLVKGETRVDILGAHTAAGKGILIKRDSTGGSDKIAAHRGHIFVENDIEYTQLAANDMGNLGSFGIIASGACLETEECITTGDTIVDGFVWLHGSALNITNQDNGSTKIKSDKHYVQIDGTFDYTGEARRRTYNGVGDTLNNTTLLVYGNTGIDVLGATTISMDSVGQATFLSTNGHIHFANTFDFIQNDMFDDNGTFNGLSVIAQGAGCGNLDCHGRPGYGYVWMEQPVTTTSLEHGRTEFVSVNHNVIMDQTLTHNSKAEGNLDVIAGGDCTSDCAIAQNILPWTYNPFSQNNLYCYTHLGGNPMGGSSTEKIASYLEQFHNQTVDFAHEGRGYIHIGDAVKVDLDSIGNATFQSKADIVQFDRTFDFNTQTGEMGDLYVDGHLGVRSIGAVKTNNPTFSSLDVYGNPIDHDDYKAHPGNYNTVNDTYQDPTDSASTPPSNSATPYDGSGNVRYNSEAGFVDFLSTFTHEALEDSSRLDIEGFTRVKFGDDVKITMSMANDTTLGETFIYSDGGFIDFWKKLDYTSRDADLRIWAKGPGLLAPSCIDSVPCTPDGHIRFFGDVMIDYTAQTALSPEGRTWIKSYNDDIFLDQMNFTYKNTTGPWNGMFWMQAGQDIFGREKGKDILFTHPGEKSIVWEAQGSIRTQQNLTFDRKDAKAGNVILKAGYDYTSGVQGSTSVYDIDVHGKDNPVSNLDWHLSSIGRTCPPQNYTHRLSCDETGNSRPADFGGDIWFQGNTTFDLSQVVKMEAADSAISVLVRAMNSVYVDSNLVYTQNQEDSVVSGKWNDKAGYFHMFAETGNIEAINAPLTSVNMTISETNNSSDIRFQAGNNPHTLSLCDHRTPLTDFFCNAHSQWDGNILFNKPLNVLSEGKGATTLSAERDIETQVDAPFTFTYNNDTIMQPLLLTAGRHIETHKMMRINYPHTTVGTPNIDQITLQAGRLLDDETTCDNYLCKIIEQGSSLTEKDNPKTLGSDEDPFEPNYGYENDFSKGGLGHGSILLFDSLEFNYNGKGTIRMTALNGNIESDPYLHRDNQNRNTPPDPGFNPDDRGYDSEDNVHHAQITFNHGGTGVTRLEAIDIKLHDKLAYYAIQHANDSNGQFYMAAFDSILTRNIEYRNHLDSGSVFITTDKYKFVGSGNDCGQYYTALGGPGIHQGHIVLGYGADCSDVNYNDSIIFDFNSTALNNNTTGANLFIKAGYTGFTRNTVTGKGASSKLFSNRPEDKDKAYGGNITFDFMKINMAKGNATSGGYTEISTPNGNIWGKDSLQYHGINGHLSVDAGLGSLDDTIRAVRWSGFADDFGAGSEKTLNTQVPYTCDEPGEWRTGNIMMKGGSLNFHDVTVPGNVGTGNAVFRTRQGFIDTYDAFTVDSMSGHLLKYAGTLNSSTEKTNQWGDVSERDFSYTPVEKSGSVYFGADDNIMMNYGYSNDEQVAADGYIYGGVGQYPVGLKSGNFTALAEQYNPYYWTTYMNPSNGFDICRAIYNVNEDGYMWYRHSEWPRILHRMYRGCEDSHTSHCSGFAGQCETVDNFARPLMFNFAYDAAGTFIKSGGLGIVATNYVDMFTEFTYFGGKGSGMASVPGMTTLHGEPVAGYGLYMKSLFTGQNVEKRRATCEDCGDANNYPIGGKKGSDPSLDTYEWTYIGFHDDARIHTNNQKSLLEAPVIEFFGHAELDAYNERGTKTSLKLKGDSLIFHDSAIFEGAGVELIPFTTGDRRQKDMRYGVINDRGESSKYYRAYGPAITMPDRNMPVIEFGYQRCNEPDRNLPHEAPNQRSRADLESTPRVGGDIIVTFKYDFALPILNSVVANHARISFISDSIDKVHGGEYIDACVRTDLLRIRNNVEFYTDPTQPMDRRGTLKMTSNDQMPSVKETGIYPHHLHLEPGSELSLPGEDSLTIISTTTVGGYGNLHESVFVKANGIIAPGYASLMEGDCQTPYKQGRLTIHDLTMEKDAVLRISIGSENCEKDPVTGAWNLNCTQTDTLFVQDTIFMRDKVTLEVMPETEYLEYGCYLFLEYGDSLGVSKEYVKNLTLRYTRFNDYHFGLDYSTPGKVFLCVMGFEQPVVQRYIELPSVAGVTTNPNAGTHYVQGHKNFSFTARYSGSPLKVTAIGAYGGYLDLDNTAVILEDGTYQYTIYQVVQPWTVSIGPEASTVSNDDISNQRVWAHKNMLYINVDREDIVSIYNMTGVLYKKVEVSEGLKKFTLERGVYVVTLKDGSVHKIIIK